MIRRYLDEVCSRVRALEAHREIRHELENHLEELVLEQEVEGIGRDEAVLWVHQLMESVRGKIGHSELTTEQKKLLNDPNLLMDSKLQSLIPKQALLVMQDSLSIESFKCLP